MIIFCRIVLSTAEKVHVLWNKTKDLQISAVVTLSLILIVTPLAYALSFVTAIPVGDDPEEVGVEEDANKIYVPAENDDVSVINGATDIVIDTIVAGNMPFGVGVNSGTDRAYVSDVDSDQVFVINTATDTVIDLDGVTPGDQGVPVGQDPRGVEVDEGLNKAFSANEGDDTVSPIDGATNTAGAAIPVGDGPFSMGIDQALNKLYVANKNDDTVSVIDTSTDTVIGAPIAVGDNPGGLAGGVGVNSVMNKAYVCNVNDGTVSVIDTNTDTVIGAPIAVGSCAGIGVNEVTNRVKVAGFNVVNEIDGATDTVIDTLAVTSNSRGVGVNPNTDKVYVANVGKDEVLVLSEAPSTVGGEILAVDLSSLLIAGTFTNAYWILPLLGGIAGATITVIKIRTRKEAQ